MLTLLPSVCVHNNIHKLKSGKKRERYIYHVSGCLWLKKKQEKNKSYNSNNTSFAARLIKIVNRFTLSTSLIDRFLPLTDFCN